MLDLGLTVVTTKFAVSWIVTVCSFEKLNVVEKCTACIFRVQGETSQKPSRRMR
jgi:hypothetical protein